jgi:flagellar basal body-associated protein FliL
METLEQVNENFNVKKPKKKGLMITGIIAAVVVVALVLLYFLVLTSPKFIFGKTIDKFLAVETENYESVKIDTKIKADIRKRCFPMEKGNYLDPILEKWY